MYLEVPYKEGIEKELHRVPFYLSEDYKIYIGDEDSKASSCAGYCTNWDIRREWNGKVYAETVELTISRT